MKGFILALLASLSVSLFALPVDIPDVGFGTVLDSYQPNQNLEAMQSNTRREFELLAALQLVGTDLKADYILERVAEVADSMFGLVDEGRTYFANGRVSSRIEKGVYLEYSESGRLVRSVHPDGWQHNYDDLGNVSRSRQVGGYCEWFDGGVLIAKKVPSGDGVDYYLLRESGIFEQVELSEWQRSDFFDD